MSSSHQDEKELYKINLPCKFFLIIMEGEVFSLSVLKV
ncbi:hypothetical protein P378_05055 [Desulforamulus profundi]|uniref:Uncharacterized protein n=1 Tax=Desulforamulus profundi TaxID=1383067 RepID=A0A2C6MI28_9FIRM|nr:hypothetical protein P378_05055 [Desulforamulus profundi]